MIGLLLLLLNITGWSQPDIRWLATTEISERHEHFENNKPIVQPKGSWEILFAVIYLNAQLKSIKDCVFYRIPGEDPGMLKIKTVNSNDACEKYLFQKGNEEWTGLKSLQFSTSSTSLSVLLTLPAYKTEKWSVEFKNQLIKKEAKLLMSSAEYHAPKILFLAPEESVQVSSKTQVLKAGGACHSISDDCQEISPSVCERCDGGWYEIPNGCPSGPKFCGQIDCGKKNQPACRRGMQWQRADKKFSCRTDSSFAYCLPGLVIQCEGSLAYCR